MEDNIIVTRSNVRYTIAFGKVNGVGRECVWLNKELILGYITYNNSNGTHTFNSIVSFLKDIKGVEFTKTFIELVSKEVNQMLYNNNIKINKRPYELVSIDGI